MRVQLECENDIWLQVNIPDTVTTDSFLDKVSQVERVIAREKRHTHTPLPHFKESTSKSGVDNRLEHLEDSMQKIISLIDGSN